MSLAPIPAVAMESVCPYRSGELQWRPQELGLCLTTHDCRCLLFLAGTPWSSQHSADPHVVVCSGKCLKNRHGEDHEVADASGSWCCPACRGSCGPGCVTCCNCGPCRKKVSNAQLHSSWHRLMLHCVSKVVRPAGNALLSQCRDMSQELALNNHLCLHVFLSCGVSAIDRLASSQLTRLLGWREMLASTTFMTTWCTW